MNNQTQSELMQQLSNRKLECEHLNAVNRELHDELTKAKLRIKELEEAAEDSHFNEIEIFERME